MELPPPPAPNDGRLPPKAFPMLTDIASGAPRRYDRRVTCKPCEPPEKPVPTENSVEIWSREGSSHEAWRANALTGTLGLKGEVSCAKASVAPSEHTAATAAATTF